MSRQPPPTDVNSLMQQAQQLATNTLNQAQDTLNQAAAASGNSDVQNAIQQSKDIIKDTQNAVNNGSIFGNTTFNTNVGNSFMTNFSADWTNSLAALQQYVFVVVVVGCWGVCCCHLSTIHHLCTT